MSKSSCKQFEYYSDMGIPETNEKSPDELRALGVNRECLTWMIEQAFSKRTVW